MISPLRHSDGYATRMVGVAVGGHDYRMRVLSDRQQFGDPHGSALAAGVSAAHWCLFGQLWPAGRVLAEAMFHRDIAGRRVLELGCGLGLSSLVLSRKGADVTASDHHPLAEPFLRHNARINQLGMPQFCDLRWERHDLTLGRFDLIIASDVLYERNHAELLAGVMDRHAHPHAELLITDPGRGNSGPFNRRMDGQGYALSEVRGPFDDRDVPPYRGRLLSFVR
jgi:SAM-dependent methyltransferase